MLLLHALGGLEVPTILFKNIRFPQRRWNIEGEIQSMDAKEFGLPPELISHLSDDSRLTQAAACPAIIQNLHEDGTITWSLRPESMMLFSITLLPQTAEHLAILVLRLICFVCPPCFEGNISWYGIFSPKCNLLLTMNLQVLAIEEVYLAIIGQSIRRKEDTTVSQKLYY